MRVVRTGFGDTSGDSLTIPKSLLTEFQKEVGCRAIALWLTYLASGEEVSLDDIKKITGMGQATIEESHRLLEGVKLLRRKDDDIELIAPGFTPPKEDSWRGAGKPKGRKLTKEQEEREYYRKITREAISEFADKYYSGLMRKLSDTPKARGMIDNFVKRFIENGYGFPEFFDWLAMTNPGADKITIEYVTSRAVFDEFDQYMIWVEKLDEIDTKAYRLASKHLDRWPSQRVQFKLSGLLKTMQTYRQALVRGTSEEVLLKAIEDYEEEDAAPWDIVNSLPQKEKEKDWRKVDADFRPPEVNQEVYRVEAEVKRRGGRAALELYDKKCRELGVKFMYEEEVAKYNWFVNGVS